MISNVTVGASESEYPNMLSDAVFPTNMWRLCANDSLAGTIRVGPRPSAEMRTRRRATGDILSPAMRASEVSDVHRNYQRRRPNH